jgi:branched-chain amino acid transport system permease protein
MSVRDNVALGAYLRGSAGVLRAGLRLDRAEERRTQAEAARAVTRVGLAAQLDEAAGSLPLGKQRIVEIARALAADPVLLLLDEPAAGLRFREKQELAALLRQLREEGMTILLVEHDMDFVMGLTDRLVVMEFGQKLAEGVPAEIQCNPAVREAYLGTGA